MFSFATGRQIVFRRLPLYAVAVFFLVLAAPAPAWAETGYTVSDIAVDASGADATEARAKAMADGERLGFEKLVAQRLAMGQSAPAVEAVPPEVISNLVQAMEVHDEKISSTRYRATLTLEFNQELFDQLARGSGVGTSSTATAYLSPTARTTHAAMHVTAAATTPTTTPHVTLVIPLFRDDAATLLWEEHNRWRSALERMKRQQQSTLLALPLGDLEDVRLASAAQVMQAFETGDYEMVAPLARKYGAQDIIIADARLRHTGPDNRQDVLEVDLSLLAPQLHKRSHASYMGLADTAGGDGVLGDAAGDLMRFVTRNQTPAMTEPAPEIVAAPPVIVPFGSEEVTAMLVPLRDLRHWHVLKQTLLGNDVVSGLELKAVSLHQADILLHHHTPLANLQAALADQGLSLRNEDGYWVLRDR